MQYIRIKDIDSVIEAYKEDGTPFILENTTFTKKVITKDKTYHFSPASDMLPCEMSLIKAVKRYADNLPDELIPKVNRKKISYIRRNLDILNSGKFIKSLEKNDITITDQHLYEIDLNKAFWEFAYRQKYISEKIYYQGINFCPDKKTPLIPLYNDPDQRPYNIIDKKTRLIALGNLAKYISITKYDGTFFTRPTPKPNRTENIFFSVAQLTDMTMKNLEMIAGNDFIFYWCDAIFFRGEETKSNIEEFLTDEMNFKYKVIPLKHISFTEACITVNDFCKPEDERPFLFEAVKGFDMSDIVDKVRPERNINFLKNKK